MKIPPNLTKTQVLKIIQKIANRLKNKYVFGYYDADDIYQECIIIAYEGLESYDGRKPLENFLSIHVHNRIKNFIRDNYYRRDYVCPKCNSEDEYCEYCHKREQNYTAKKNLIDTIDIGSIDMDGEKNCYYTEDYAGKIDNKDLINKIRQNLPANKQLLFVKFMQNAYIPADERNELIETIKEIIECEPED